MSNYTPDDAAMTHGNFDPVAREGAEHIRTMNRMQARKDELIDLLVTPLPPAEARNLAAELEDLKHDIAAVRYGADDRTWRDMRSKWRK